LLAQYLTSNSAITERPRCRSGS